MRMRRAAGSTVGMGGLTWQVDVAGQAKILPCERSLNVKQTLGSVNVKQTLRFFMNTKLTFSPRVNVKQLYYLHPPRWRVADASPRTPDFYSEGGTCLITTASVRAPSPRDSLLAEESQSTSRMSTSLTMR